MRQQLKVTFSRKSPEDPGTYFPSRAAFKRVRGRAYAQYTRRHGARARRDHKPTSRPASPRRRPRARRVSRATTRAGDGGDDLGDSPTAGRRARDKIPANSWYDCHTSEETATA